MLGAFKTFANSVNSIFKSNQLDEASIEELEALLYTSDFGTEVVENHSRNQKRYSKTNPLRQSTHNPSSKSLLKN